MSRQSLRMTEHDAPRKALYLMSAHTQHIHSDTTRLIIQGGDTAPRPFPFTRIHRILSGPNTQWQGNAIAACLTRDIPIIWLDHNNHPVGDAHPHHRQGGLLHHDLQHYLDLPDWNPRYQNWHKNRRMDVLNQLRAQRIHSSSDHEQHKRSYVYQNRPQSQATPEARAFCQSIVNQQLAEHHARTRYWGTPGQPLEIAADLADLLAQEYHLSHPQQPKTAIERIQQLETWWQDHAIRLHHHLSDLHKHIKTESDTWLQP